MQGPAVSLVQAVVVWILAADWDMYNITSACCNYMPTPGQVNLRTGSQVLLAVQIHPWDTQLLISIISIRCSPNGVNEV